MSSSVGLAVMLMKSVYLSLNPHDVGCAKNATQLWFFTKGFLMNVNRHVFATVALLSNMAISTGKTVLCSVVGLVLVTMMTGESGVGDIF